MLRFSAAKPPGLLEVLVTTVMGVADLTVAGRRLPNSAVVDRLLRTLLFLPVAGLARTWDLRSYTGTMLAILRGSRVRLQSGIYRTISGPPGPRKGS